MVEELCAMAGLPPLHSPCLALAAPSHLWDLQRLLVEERPFCALAAPHPPAQCRALLFLPAGVWWVMGARSVLPGQSRMCVSP